MAADAARWAKAPDLADRPGERARLRERTEADRRDQLEGGMSPVRCLSCQACVLVRKNSAKHLSIQWNPEAVRSCEELTARSDGGSSALVDSCERLHESIDRSVHAGHVPIGGGEPDVRGDSTP